MVLLDAAFLIFLFGMVNSNVQWGAYPLNKDLIPTYAEMVRDIFLEENQLPFFVLEDIFQEAFNGSTHFPSFWGIAYDFTNRLILAESGIAKIRVAEASKVEHLVDMMRILYLPSNLRTHPDYNKNLRFPPSISKLCAAGVKLVSNKTNTLLDVTFTNGVLEMPTLVVTDELESFFRSIILFEQRHHYDDTYLIEYAHFLDRLIDTADDVLILTQAGILENWLGSDQAVADVFNGITDHLSFSASNFYYGHICEDLRVFASIKSNRWKAVLRRDYFNHPWAIISVIYAVILLILTVLQTIFSFTNYKK